MPKHVASINSWAVDKFRVRIPCRPAAVRATFHQPDHRLVFAPRIYEVNASVTKVFGVPGCQSRLMDAADCGDLGIKSIDG